MMATLQTELSISQTQILGEVSKNHILYLLTSKQE